VRTSMPRRAARGRQARRAHPRPEGGAGFRGIGARGHPGADGRGAQPLVEAGESIVGGGERPISSASVFAAKSENRCRGRAGRDPARRPGGRLRGIAGKMT